MLRTSREASWTPADIRPAEGRGGVRGGGRFTSKPIWTPKDIKAPGEKIPAKRTEGQASRATESPVAVSSAEKVVASALPAVPPSHESVVSPYAAVRRRHAVRAQVGTVVHADFAPADLPHEEAHILLATCPERVREALSSRDIHEAALHVQRHLHAIGLPSRDVFVASRLAWRELYYLFAHYGSVPAVEGKTDKARRAVLESLPALSETPIQEGGGAFDHIVSKFLGRRLGLGFINQARVFLTSERFKSVADLLALQESRRGKKRAEKEATSQPRNERAYRPDISVAPIPAKQHQAIADGRTVFLKTLRAAPQDTTENIFKPAAHNVKLGGMVQE